MIGEISTLVYTLVAIAGFIASGVFVYTKFNREAERHESWLKTHEKEIQELKENNKEIKQEHRRLESMIGEIAISLGKIDVKLEILLGNKLKANQNEGT